MPHIEEKEKKALKSNYSHWICIICSYFTNENKKLKEVRFYVFIKEFELNVSIANTILANGFVFKK